MGIYIKGMKMPPNCGFCNLLYHCTTHIGEEINLYIRNICRHPDCPLIEVKPHGDLIDRDAIPIYRYDFENGDLVHRIDDVPVVIEAESE